MFVISPYLNSKTSLKKIWRNTLSAYTFIEVLISISILSSLFLLLMHVILSLYRANQYITTLNNVTIQASQMHHILEKLLVSAEPRSVECHPSLPHSDMNGDGHSDIGLLKFSTIYNEQKYLLVQERNVPVPYRNNESYTLLSLYKYNKNTNKYERFIILFDPVINVKNVQIQCNPAPAQEDKLQNVWFTTVTLSLEIDSLNTYLFIPGLADTKIVTNYPFFLSTLVIN